MRAKAILAAIFGLGAALFIHAAILLFGGWFFLKEDGSARSTMPVELIDDSVDQDKKPDVPKPDEKPEDDLQKSDDTPPDTDAVVEKLDNSPVTDLAPRLDEASLAGLANALGGVGSGGEFFEGETSLEGGGMIGGTGRRGEEGTDPIEAAFDPAGIDQEARALVQTSPSYPNEMRGKKVEGAVTLIFVVDANGKVENPKVETSTHKAFESPALAAVRKWKFEPGIRAGERVASKKRITIRFPAA